MDQATAIIKLETVLAELDNLKAIVTTMAANMATLIDQNTTLMHQVGALGEQYDEHAEQTKAESKMYGRAIGALAVELNSYDRRLTRTSDKLDALVDAIIAASRRNDDNQEEDAADGEILDSEMQLDSEGSDAASEGSEYIIERNRDASGDVDKVERRQADSLGDGTAADHEEGGGSENDKHDGTAPNTATPATTADGDATAADLQTADDTKPIPPTPRTAWKTNKNPNDGPVHLRNLVASRTHDRLAALTVIDPTLAADGKVDRTIGPQGEKEAAQIKGGK